MTDKGLSLQQANQILIDNFAPWVLSLNPTVTELSDKGATLLMPFARDLNREGGIVSGQALMALADTAMVIAVCQVVGSFCPVATVSMNTTFMRAARESDVIAAATVAKRGRMLSFVEVELLNAADKKLLGQAQVTCAMPKP